MKFILLLIFIFVFLGFTFWLFEPSIKRDLCHLHGELNGQTTVYYELQQKCFYSTAEGLEEIK